MPKLDKILKEMEKSPQNIRLADLEKVCEHYFGEPRTTGGSHKVYKMPWQGDPRINLQKTKDGKAKAYQVKQVMTAIRKLGRQ